MVEIEIHVPQKIEVDGETAKTAAQAVVDRWNASADSETKTCGTEELLNYLRDEDIVAGIPQTFTIPEEWDLVLTPEEWQQEVELDA